MRWTLPSQGWFYFSGCHPVQADLAMLAHNLWGCLPNLVGMEMPFLIVVPGAGTGQLGRVGARLPCCLDSGGPVTSSRQDGRHWDALAPLLGRLGSETRVWDVQGGSVERASVAYVAALKFGLVFGGQGDRAGGRGEPFSTRGHCCLAAQPRNMKQRK